MCYEERYVSLRGWRKDIKKTIEMAVIVTVLPEGAYIERSQGVGGIMKR